MYWLIVVALDGSHTAEEALPHAISLAQKYGALLILVTVAHTLNDLDDVAPSLSTSPAVSQDVVSRLESAREQTSDRQYLAGVRDRIAAQGIDVETRLRQGEPAEQILEAASELHADLIVLTAYGAGGAHTRTQRAVFGGVADAVLRDSHIPTLLVRP